LRDSFFVISIKEDEIFDGRYPFSAQMPRVPSLTPLTLLSLTARICFQGYPVN